MAAIALAQEKIWVDKPTYDKAERLFHERAAKGNQESTCSVPTGGSLANEVAKARQHIKQSLQCMDGIAAMSDTPASKDVSARVAFLEKENQELKKFVKNMEISLVQATKKMEGLEKRVEVLEGKLPESIANKDDDEDDDLDLFDAEDEEVEDEAKRIREERLAAYNAKKAKKPVLIAKSSIILDVKPWSDETDMKALEAEVRKIQTEGLLWGAAKLVPLAYGIHKLQICCVVEDEKVSVDWLTEQIQEQEEYVQSVDIAAFNKI